MSNSAVVQFGMDPATAPAVYLHRHGDPASVQAFLDVAKRLSVRDNDPTYAAARFTQNVSSDICSAEIAANVIGGTLGIGVGPMAEAPNDLDHGVYVVDGLDVIDRQRSHMAWALDRRPTFDDPQFDAAAYERMYRLGYSTNRTRLSSEVTT